MKLQVIVIFHILVLVARRMQVTKTEFQHQVMIEAVENHMPQVIVVDEIGTELEVCSSNNCRKGVQLVGTAVIV
jgi:stage III sporulation protein SpoIIIAA